MGSGLTQRSDACDCAAAHEIGWHSLDPSITPRRYLDRTPISEAYEPINIWSFVFSFMRQSNAVRSN
ncbi:hypothetical protein BHL63_08760 [Xanthomonas alfalfae]|nr:hypothetical protein BHL63_08760 [Xanthomonas alfalfae]